MLNKETVTQSAQLTSLTSSLRQYSTKVVESIVKLLQPYLPEGASMPDVALVFQLMLELFHDSGTKLIETNWQRLEEKAGDSNLREARELAVAGLRPKLFRIRDLVNGAVGPVGLRTLDLENGIDTVPPILLHQANYVDARLRDPTLFDGVTLWAKLDLLELAELLQPDLGTLQITMASLTSEQRATEASFLELSQIYVECRRHYVGGGKVIEGLYRLIGMKDEADRLRLVQRQTRTATSFPPSDGEGSDTGSPPDGNPQGGRSSETGEGEDTGAGDEAPNDEDSDGGSSEDGSSEDGISEDGTL